MNQSIGLSPPAVSLPSPQTLGLVAGDGGSGAGTYATAKCMIEAVWRLMAGSTGTWSWRWRSYPSWHSGNGNGTWGGGSNGWPPSPEATRNYSTGGLSKRVMLAELGFDDWRQIENPSITPQSQKIPYWSFYDMEGKLVNGSKTYCNLLGWTIQELLAYQAKDPWTGISNPIIGLLYGQDVAERDRVIEQVSKLSSDHTQSYEMVCYPHDCKGRKLIFRFTTRVVFDEKHERIGTFRIAEYLWTKPKIEQEIGMALPSSLSQAEGMIQILHMPIAIIGQDTSQRAITNPALCQALNVPETHFTTRNARECMDYITGSTEPVKKVARTVGFNAYIIHTRRTLSGALLQIFECKQEGNRVLGSTSDRAMGICILSKERLSIVLPRGIYEAGISKNQDGKYVFTNDFWVGVFLEQNFIVEEDNKSVVLIREMLTDLLSIPFGWSIDAFNSRYGKFWIRFRGHGWWQAIVWPTVRKQGWSIVCTFDRIEGTPWTDRPLHTYTHADCVLRLLPDSIMIAYESGKTVFCSDAYADITGYTAEHLRSLSPEGIIDLLYKGEENARVKAFIAHIHMRGQGYSGEAFTLTTAWGKLVTLVWTSMPYGTNGSIRVARKVTDPTEIYRLRGERDTTYPMCYSSRALRALIHPKDKKYTIPQGFIHLTLADLSDRLMTHKDREAIYGNLPKNIRSEDDRVIRHRFMTEFIARLGRSLGDTAITLYRASEDDDVSFVFPIYDRTKIEDIVRSITRINSDVFTTIDIQVNETTPWKPTVTLFESLSNTQEICTGLKRMRYSGESQTRRYVWSMRLVPIFDTSRDLSSVPNANLDAVLTTFCNSARLGARLLVESERITHNMGKRGAKPWWTNKVDTRDYYLPCLGRILDGRLQLQLSRHNWRSIDPIVGSSQVSASIPLGNIQRILDTFASS